MIRAIATAALEAALAWLRCQRAQCDLSAKLAAQMSAQVDARDVGTKGNQAMDDEQMDFASACLLLRRSTTGRTQRYVGRLSDAVAAALGRRWSNAPWHAERVAAVKARNRELKCHQSDEEISADIVLGYLPRDGAVSPWWTTMLVPRESVSQSSRWPLFPEYRTTVYWVGATGCWW